MVSGNSQTKGDTRQQAFYFARIFRLDSQFEIDTPVNATSGDTNWITPSAVDTGANFGTSFIVDPVLCVLLVKGETTDAQRRLTINSAQTLALITASIRRADHFIEVVGLHDIDIAINRIYTSWSGYRKH